MSNIILWSHQSTVDHNFRVGERISKVASELLAQHREWLNSNAKSEVEKTRQEDKDWVREDTLLRILERIRDHGLSQDIKKDITQYTEMPEKIELIREYLNRNFEGETDVGGDPAIAALRGYFLRQGREDTDLPLVFYAGLLPKSVEEALRDEKLPSAWEEVTRVRQEVPDKPQSIGLETRDYKLIVIYSPGRSIVDLAPNSDFTRFFALLEGVMAGNPGGLAVLAVNAGKPKEVKIKDEKGNKRVVSEMDILESMIAEVKQTTFGKRVRIFVATRVFGGDIDFAHRVFDLLKKADIISVNDSEAHDLHTAYKGSFVDIPLAYKLRMLPFEAIKVCHSADGVIMDLGCIPEKIITSRHFRENPSGFLEDILRFSADGATYAMDATAGLGRNANEAMIRIYSQNVSPESRQNDLFNRTFRNVREPMPAGMLWVPSARVVNTLGAVVGLGAIFDGLLLSFLMRD